MLFHDISPKKDLLRNNAFSGSGPAVALALVRNELRPEKEEGKEGTRQVRDWLAGC